MARHKRTPAKKLLVEGKTEMFAIPELMEKNGVEWGTRINPIVTISEYGGIEKLLKPEVIATELDSPNLEALGLIVDADSDPNHRWQKIYRACEPFASDIPNDAPENGVILTAYTSGEKPIRFGIWMMPDNKTEGMLETFLAYLIADDDPLWDEAQLAVKKARAKKALFKESYTDKAKIHTWLAWQEEPGLSLGAAIKYKCLDSQHPCAQSFVHWFKALYQL